MRTCLQIIQDAAKRIGISAPNTAASATDIQVIQLMALLDEEGRELSQRCQWQVLVKEQTFTTQAQESQGDLVGDIISEADGFSYVLNDTMWDRNQNWPVYGPNAPQRWQYLKSSNITGPFSTYRIRGGELLFNPAPPAGNTVAFEFVTEHWVKNAAGDITRAQFTSDDDVPLLPDRLLTQGLNWRWKQAKGFSYQEDFNKYERQVIDAMARDGSKRHISLSGMQPGFDPFVIAPSGSWDL